MFRYHVELLGCEWMDGQPPEGGGPVACLEVYCHRRGARRRVAHFPSEFEVRSAPETDTLFLSVLHGDTVLASSEAIPIGGVNRCVGFRTVALKAGEAALCKVRIMWSVEAEDGTAFSRRVEDFAGGEGHTAPVATERDRLSTHPERLPVVGEAPATEKVSAVSEAPPVLCEVPATSAVPQPQEQGATTLRRDALPPASPERGAQWSVGGPQHAPKGLLDYYVTSTQVVERPKAWRNLYTSPAPLLVACGLLQDGAEAVPMTTTTTTRGKRCGRPTYTSVLGASSLDDIRLHPTKAPQSVDDIRQTLYTRKMNLKWRTVVSPLLAALPPAMRGSS
ncbi:uncharacterized protein Tco025E_02334 [Trypanosoma conorhini]|uniref:Uncharacterized protein n=1 Tax=Trypanosoma conorhini TaxID=83891 RepID=A0A422Q565_9TRYP|nr:uncharacterized protein Tco025E_02334 [Trypanosoma conorhini]RNF25101.1 hypothetical protein Tco025E_02334 [Trypanosoma conorhini]